MKFNIKEWQEKNLNENIGMDKSEAKSYIKRLKKISDDIEDIHTEIEDGFGGSGKMFQQFDKMYDAIDKAIEYIKKEPTRFH